MPTPTPSALIPVPCACVATGGSPRTRRHLLRRSGLLLAACALFTGVAAAATAPPGLEPQAARPLPSQWRLGVESIRLPGAERVGLVGGSYLVGLGQGWWLGPGVYGAASGQRGGLFVLGGEALWRTAGPAGSRLEAGLYLGGGGGAAAPVGGGLMLRPHLDWLWPVGPAWVGVSASRLRFPSGAIGSSQLGLVLSVDDSFSVVDAGRRVLPGAGRGGLGFDRVWLNVGRYSARTVNPGSARYSYGGLRADHLVGQGYYLGIESSGAAQGGADGYAEVLGSAGLEWPLAGAWHVGVRGAAGLAGGGAVSTGGGPLLKLAGTLRWDLAPDWLLGLEAGRAVAPDGQLRANYLHLGLGMVLSGAGGSSTGAGSGERADVHEWSAALSTLPRMHYRDGSVDTVQTVGLRLRRPLSPALDERLQLAGGVHFAAGGRAGAYGAGLIGLALATPLQQPGWQWGAAAWRTLQLLPAPGPTRRGIGRGVENCRSYEQKAAAAGAGAVHTGTHSQPRAPRRCSVASCCSRTKPKPLPLKYALGSKSSYADRSASSAA